MRMTLSIDAVFCLLTPGELHAGGLRVETSPCRFVLDSPESRLEYRKTIVPTWKNVGPFDCMLNWSDCIGLWLADVSEDWGFMFDPWYWPNYFCVKRGSRRERFWPKVYPKGWAAAKLVGCPPYLVKDSMVLAVLAGCRYFQYERFAFRSRPLSRGK